MFLEHGVDRVGGEPVLDPEVCEPAGALLEAAGAAAEGAEPQDASAVAEGGEGAAPIGWAANDAAATETSAPLP
jgi:hypothetical protein